MTARRAIWIIRAIVYGLLALAAALLLAYRGGHGDAEAEAHTLFGKAAGKRDFTVVVRDRRVVAFNTAISVRCDVSYLVQLGAYDGHRGAHFVTEGEHVRLSFTAPWDRAGDYVQHARLEARFDGTRLTGTLESVVTTVGRHEPLCSSGPVGISAHE